MTGTEIFKGAKFIDCPGSEAPVFRKKFNAQKGEKAVITICGLGFFRLYINGRKVSDDLLVPNASCYSERDMSRFAYPLKDKLTFRTYCLKYDITDYLVQGENTLCVLLGCGYYCQEHHSAEGYVSFGYPKLCYVIEKQSGNVLSDSSTLSNKGFISSCVLYDGEVQDYTALPADFMLNSCKSGDFHNSREIETPDSNYVYQTMRADRVVESITPVLLSEENGIRLFDAGVNTVGYAVIRCPEKGRTIKVEYAEEIYDERPWYGVHFNEVPQSETFITDGENREYIPLFTWHGFRYFRVYGECEVLRVDVVHADCPVSSSFESDSEQLNWLYEAFVHTQLCNMHSGVPSDCPHRERLGYTGDGQLCCEAAMLTLDCKDFYRKWLTDISDSQCLETGHVGHTAPVMGGGGGPSGWGGAIVEVPYKFWKIYGDKQVIEEFFPKMLRYFDYLESRSENMLICREEEGGWCLGDWCTPDKIKIPEAFVNTCLYVKFMQQVLEIAEAIGKEEQAEYLKKRIELRKRAIDVAYFSKATGAYCGDIQGASCLALQIGCGNEKVKENVCEKYKKLGMFDTGIIATEALTGYLFGIGENQLAFNLLAGTGEVSFDFMRRHGATTLWENWDGASSRNHPMFGAVVKYLFTRFLGISQSESSCGFEEIVISPIFVDGLDRCKGHIVTPKGKVSVEYKKHDGKAQIAVSVPENAQARFVYGNINKTFSGKSEFSVEVKSNKP